MANSNGANSYIPSARSIDQPNSIFGWNQGNYYLGRNGFQKKLSEIINILSI